MSYKTKQRKTMKIARFFIAFFLLLVQAVRSQSIQYTSEGMVGNRSYFYTHTISYQISEKVKLQNLVVFDTEYKGDSHNIFFIRNTIAYQFAPNFTFNTAIGMKNPGKFATGSVQYTVTKNDLLFSYSVGATYQRGWTLEQSLLVEYTPKINEEYSALIRLSAVGNVNTEECTRGFQQIRLGVKKNKVSFGIAINLDQFNTSWDHLENYGVFGKFNF